MSGLRQRRWRVRTSILAVILCWLFAGTAASAGDARDDAPRLLAITIDDLPWAVMDGLSEAQLQSRHERLMRQLDLAGVPVTGFVNEGKLEVDGKVDPQRLARVEDWVTRGHVLGNHTHGHVDLHAVGLEAFQEDVLRGERQLRPMLAAHGTAPRWFRHPYLRAGRTPRDRAALDAFLAKHGYRVAPVTVDNSDWLWAAAYRNVLDGLSNEAARERTLARLRTDYVPYMFDKIDYFDRQSRQLLGRSIAQIWLLHANELNAEVFGELVEGARARGNRIVGLDEAMRDPAYARGAEGYDGPRGPSWLHRWAIGAGKQPGFFTGEPETPAWVVALAGFDSE
ncbi:polysaccharide deacetylase family protein [uncultured Luteimonas sp.]|uniref:polysaccharide deacetylase family protein n=1 Tax=uncultured Luteimonas sp. TaxID=453144 RepID=UPI002610FD6F|nr:polysaccharide deacetylase family protein [uncultured Luteimonas sp.]